MDEVVPTHRWRASILQDGPGISLFVISRQTLYAVAFRQVRRNAMPALAPKSAVTYRPRPSEATTEEPSRVARASRNQPTSQKQPARKDATGRPNLRLLSVIVGMVLMLSLVVLSQFLLGWGQTTWDDLHYGRPRTFQIDAFVGHETGKVPSHFIALNLHGQVEIIELPGGDARQAKIYVGPRIYGSGADLVPVTLRFVDSAHNHHPAMLILFQNAQVVFRNVNGAFQPATP
jgi:hypothetical protein